MALGYIARYKKSSNYKATNVVELIKEARLEKTREKKKTILAVAAAASVLTIAGVVISS
tara:strand:- start:128 stop:304 length:177 start_codon:yes stop_codon:yes gene_type:complete